MPCVDSGGRAGRMKVQLPSSSVRDIPMLSVRHHSEKRLPNSRPGGYENSSVQQGVANLDQSYCPLPLLPNPTSPMPVVRFQANLLADGILLGMSLNHHIADATGAEAILKLLAEGCCASSAQDVSLLPNGKVESELRKRLSSAVDSLNPHRDHLLEDRQLEDKPTNDVLTANGSKPAKFSGPGLSTRSFVFSNEKIGHLRDLCNSLMPVLPRGHQGSQNGTVPANNHWHDLPSLNNVLTAVLGLCVGRARAKSGPVLPNSTGVSIAVNLRRHFQPPLPDHYIGNAVRVARVVYHYSGDNLCPDYDIDTGSLAGLPSSLDNQELLYIANIASRIRVMVNSTSNEHIQGLLSSMNDRSDSNETQDQPPDLWISSWRHLSIYNLEFGPGMGIIDSFESPSGLVDGACVILPARKASEGNVQPAPWDVRLTLKSEDMERLIDDRLFRWVSDGYGDLDLDDN